jgi:hypothetical protein
VVSLDAAVPEYILAAADRVARIQQEGNGPQNCSVLIDVMDGVWHTEWAAMPCAKFHQMPFDDDWVVAGFGRGRLLQVGASQLCLTAEVLGMTVESSSRDRTTARDRGVTLLVVALIAELARELQNMKIPASSLRAARELNHENIHLSRYDDHLEMPHDEDDANLGFDEMPESKLIAVVALLAVEGRPCSRSCWGYSCETSR